MMSLNLEKVSSSVVKAVTPIVERGQKFWTTATERIKSYTRLFKSRIPSPWLTLIQKVTLSVACLIIVSVIVFWTRRNVSRFEKETVAKVNQYMFGIAREKGQCVEQFVRDIQDYLGLLARKPFSGEFKKGQPVAYYDYLAGEALLEHVGGRVHSIARLDKSGIVLHRVPFQRSYIGKDYSKMPGIKYVLENRKPYVGEIFPFNSGKYGFHVCHPVFDKDNFLGILCIVVLLDTLDESVCHIQAETAGSIWMINGEGVIVSHADHDLIGKSILDVESGMPTDKDKFEFEEIVQKMIDGEEGYGVYETAAPGTGKVKKAIAYLPIDLGDQVWSVALTMDYNEIAAPVKRNTRNNFLGAALMMSIVGLMGTIYYKSQRKKAELEAIARSAEELRISNDKLTYEIEQRNQAERAREESESNYRLLADNVLDIIWVVDFNLKFTYVSPSVSRILGFERHEVIGQKIEEFMSPSSLEPARKAFLDEMSFEAKEQKKVHNAGILDLEIYRKDKTTIWAETKFSSLHDAKGTLKGLLGVTRDITEKRQLQQQLVQAQKMESIGTLAGGVAHDFNNLLGGILGYATLLKTQIDEDHHLMGYADTIEKSAKRAAELTAQLLAFARGGRYEPKVVSLNKIVQESLEIIRRTFDKLIEIDIHLDEAVPTVEVDAGQIQQVLINLCVNARDAMSGGGKLTIVTGTEIISPEEAEDILEARSGSYVILSVADTGVGMTKETIARIFDPFFTTKEKGKGTGLGLAMVYGVVRNHGGYVQVESKLGMGTVFKVFLPISGKAETLSINKPAVVRGGNELILVVDDEEVVRYLAKDVLESHGYRVLLAKDGVEALDTFQEYNGNIGLVIIDMIMPKMGGRETFLKLKELNPKIKALLATGYDRNGEAREILRSGVIGFIQKPFQLDELLCKVRSVLDGNMS